MAIAGALAHGGVEPGAVDEVLFGHVLQAGEGQITARQAAVRGGLPMTVPSVTINKVCLSGMAAIGLAERGIGPGIPSSWSPVAWRACPTPLTWSAI